MKTPFRFLALGLGTLLLGGCAASGGQNLEQRVQQHDAQLRQLQPNQADTWNQMQAMRQELNALKGQMDDLNNAGGARALVDRVRRHDAALRQVNTNMALNLDLGEPMGATASAAPSLPQPIMPAGGITDAASAGQAPTAAPAVQGVPMGGAAAGSYGLPPDGQAAAGAAGAAAGTGAVQAPTGSTGGPQAGGPGAAKGHFACAL